MNRERWGPLSSHGAPGEVMLILKGELEFSRKKRRVFIPETLRMNK